MPSTSSPEARDLLRVACAQIPNEVGDLTGNSQRIYDAMGWAEAEGADVLVLPELALTGYPLSDLALRDDFIDAAGDTLNMLARHSGSTTTILSAPDRVPPRQGTDSQPRSISIGAALLCDGRVRGWYHKVLLPTYAAFEEGRYFLAGRHPDAVWRIGGVVAGVAICEDAWSDDGPPEAQAAAGARILLIPNASPFHRGKPDGRYDLMRAVARRNGVPVVYANSVGGLDDLVFDGGSLIVDADGALMYRAAQFSPERFVVDVPVAPPRPLAGRPSTVHTRVTPPRAAEPVPDSPPRLEPLEQVWRALVMGTRDFVRHGGFPGVVVAVSGGIDSAVTAAVASDALGPDAVLVLAMPADDTPDAETDGARALCDALGVELRVLPLPDVALHRALVGRAVDGSSSRLTGEDLAARTRAAVLMAAADELGRLALATGNKTELSIGAGVLFGDMAGGFAPLRDCPKTLVYALGRHRNRAETVIPAEAIAGESTLRDRADGLPPYEQLDAIVERYVELGEGPADIVAAGFSEDVVHGVLQLVDDAEFKRRQVAPGVKVTARAFAGDRRMPIANLWRPFAGNEFDLSPSDDG